MRILLVAPTTIPLPPPTYGGIERIVCGLAGELASRGHVVTVVAPEGSTLPGVTCVPWLDFRAGGFRQTIKQSMHLREITAKTQVEVVHSFSRTAFLLGLLSMRPRLPIIESYGVLPTAAARLPVALLGSRLTLTGCSEWISKRGVQIAGGAWKTIYNFVDVGRFEPIYSVGLDAPLVFLSRVDSIKGPDLAIEVARRTGRRLVIAGNVAPDGPDNTFWQCKVKPQLEPGKIDYVGPVNDEQKSKLLGSAAALLVPVRWKEPFGLVFAEALACGTPVISCPRGSLTEIVRHGVEGFLGETPDELSEAVDRIGLIDRRNCRRRVEECFTTARIADDYEKLYRDLLQANSPQLVTNSWR